MNDFKIYVKDWDKKKFTSVKDVLTYYFKKNCPATYFENGEIQCDEYCNRSFYDLLSLVSYYIDKDIEELKKELAFTLIELLINNHIRSIYCGIIKKHVFYNKGMHGYYFIYEIKDNLLNQTKEKPYINVKGSDGLSIIDIYEIGYENTH